MPADYSNTTYSFLVKRDCIELNTSTNYVIYPNIGYSIIDKNTREKKKVVCENKNFKIDQEKFNSIVVKKSFDK